MLRRDFVLLRVSVDFTAMKLACNTGIISVGGILIFWKVVEQEGQVSIWLWF